jgi:hypothetical protein
MSKPKTHDTVVVSFRVPVDLEKRVAKRAKKEKKKRATFVASVFTPAFEQLLNSEKQTA